MLRGEMSGESERQITMQRTSMFFCFCVKLYFNTSVCVYKTGSEAVNSINEPWGRQAENHYRSGWIINELVTHMHQWRLIAQAVG